MATESGFVENWQSGRSVVECNRQMLTSKHSSDVTFRVGKDGETVRAHRDVLISRSCVFDAMLCGPLAEKDGIKISDVEADVFSEMLMYLYTNGATVTSKNVTGLLFLAKKYAVGGLERLCLTFLENGLTPENANDVVLYDRHKLFSHGQAIQNRVYDRVRFSCSQDITLRSIYLYGGGGGEKDFSSCRISTESFFGGTKIALRSSEVILEAFDIKRYHLDTPVAIRANSQYYIHVEMENGSPVYVGDGMRERVTAGKCTLLFVDTHVVGHSPLIYALDITSQEA